MTGTLWVSLSDSAAGAPGFWVWMSLTSRSEVMRQHKPRNLAKSVTVE